MNARIKSGNDDSGMKGGAASDLRIVALKTSRYDKYGPKNAKSACPNRSFAVHAWCQ